jgi:hypothetical protein
MPHNSFFDKYYTTADKAALVYIKNHAMVSGIVSNSYWWFN